MDILQMTCLSIEKKELISFLRGDNDYKVESSQYAPYAEITDIGKVLSRGIYKAYQEHKYVGQDYEQALISMLDLTDYDVYVVCAYITSQLFKEKNGLSPFQIEKVELLSKLKGEIDKRKLQIQNGITYPNGYKNKNAWEELERFNSVCKEEYDLALF